MLCYGWVLMLNQKTVEKQLKPCNVIWVDKGIASRIDNTIFLNVNLLLYPDYLMKIMDHEKRHDAGFSWKNIWMDLTEGNFFDNMKFLLKHGKAWTYFIPMGKSTSRWYIDPFMLSLEIILVILIIGVVMVV